LYNIADRFCWDNIGFECNWKETRYYIKINHGNFVCCSIAIPLRKTLRYCFYRCFFPDFRLGPGTVRDTRRLSRNEREETLSVFEEHLPWRNAYIEGFKVLGTASYIFIFVPRDYARRFIRLALPTPSRWTVMQNCIIVGLRGCIVVHFIFCFPARCSCRLVGFINHERLRGDLKKRSS